MSGFRLYYGSKIAGLQEKGTMPDADQIGKFSRRWSKMYTKLCEGYFDSESLANDAIVSLRKDIEAYENHPIRLLMDASHHLEGVLNNPLFLPVHDWGDEDRFIRDLKFSYMQRYRLNQRGLDLAVKAYKKVVHALRNGGDISGNLADVVIGGYIRNIYESNFAELVPVTLQGQRNVDSVEVSNRLNGMDFFINEHIHNLSEQIVKRKSVKHLRLPSRSFIQKIISLTDDVFNLGNKA
jgi:hypothetical protein